jgi:hypothetical protein
MTRMTPAQHRAQADLLRQAGNLELAHQHNMLARAIERRARIVWEGRPAS